MLGYKTSKNPFKPRTSLDGFVSRSGSLDGLKTTKSSPQNNISSNNIDEIVSLTDGFTASNRQIADPQLTVPDTHTLQPRYATELRESTRRKRSYRKIFKRVFLAGSMASLAVLLVGGFLFGKAWLGARKALRGGGGSAVLFSKEVRPEELLGEGEGRVNVLLAGIGGGDHPGADLTDSIVVASIDPVAKTITLISVPRDLWVKVPDFWSMKINAAYSNAKATALENSNNDDAAQQAGFKTLEQTIEQTLGIPIHYHALVNFQAFKEGVDAVGGITIDVKEPLYDPMIAWELHGDNPDTLIAAKGSQVFNGQRALLYSRSRYSSSDFARGERQREVLIALKDKILTSGTFKNPKTITKLIDTFGDNIMINASLGELARMYEITKSIPPTSIFSTSFSEEPNALLVSAIIDEQDVVVPALGVRDFSEIQSFIRNTVRDPYLAQENAAIVVLNGSGIEGAAARRAEELKSYGYNVTVVDVAPTSNYVKTVLYSREGSRFPYTKNYLEKRLGVTATSSPDPSLVPISTDFVIVVGSNEANETDN